MGVALKNLSDDALLERYWRLRAKVHQGAVRTSRELGAVLRSLTLTTRAAAARNLELGAP